MRSAFKVLKEQVSNFYLIHRLSIFELKSDNTNSYLGILWEIISPMIQIAIYWFIFGYGIRANRPVALDKFSVPYFPWMLSGIIVWFFVNQSITLGTKSVFSRLRMISKMSFPMSVIPTFVIFAKFYQHLMLTLIIWIILQLMGFHISIYIIQLPYFMLCTILFLFGFTLITSTLATIVRDIQMIIPSFNRILLYLTPLLWATSRLPGVVQGVMELNPLYYIVEGYRSSLLGTEWYFIDHWKYTLYFWFVIILLLMIGSFLHLKFRNRFVDFL